MIPLGLGALLGAFLATNAVDTGILAHGLLIGLFCVAGIIWVIKRGNDTGGAADPAPCVSTPATMSWGGSTGHAG